MSSPSPIRPVQLRTAAEAARLLSCSAKTVRRLAASGRLTGMHLLPERFPDGRKRKHRKDLRITEASIRRYQAEQAAADYERRLAPGETQ